MICPIDGPVAESTEPSEDEGGSDEHASNAQLAEFRPEKRCRIRQSCRLPPPKRSKWADNSTPDEGKARRKALSKVYEERRRQKKNVLDKANAIALRPKPLIDELRRDFKDVGEVLVDARARVRAELVRVRGLGRHVIVDYEEREDFLQVLDHRLGLLYASLDP